MEDLNIACSIDAAFALAYNQRGLPRDEFKFAVEDFKHAHGQDIAEGFVCSFYRNNAHYDLTEGLKSAKDYAQYLAQEWLARFK